ncbi:uncharacterized protein LOC119386213 [Rhipicephalus sanguineus]|uniref:Secreted protein n=1 Tax=Rhipicephalus sanguineus TaxID=34632 RepID=A0A9D4Q1V8_RHISA|nr:uncharacterized protein LOC119386213 [Rhipicephalus sanguineus]KAH7962975.1 hypothetical protein HPB52_019006 [Rhipicephalus sanguineus]
MSVRLLLLALFTIAKVTVIHGAPICQHLLANGSQHVAGSNAIVSSVARLVQIPQRSSREAEGGVRLFRQRRQSKLLCLGNAVVTTLVSTLLERNRERIKENEPIYIGGTQNLGLIVLKNGRGVNVHTAFFNGEIEVDCTTDPEWISITFPVGIRNPDVVFDYELPGGLLSGELKARFELFGANVVLRLPKDRSGGLKPYIADVNFWSTQGFKMEITGMGPVSSALTTGLTLVYQLLPMPLMEFFRVLMMRVMQQFLETAPLPF